MRVLVTGAGGFAGSHLTEYLVGCNLQVVALVSPRDALANLKHILSQIEIVRGDVRDSSFMLDVLRRIRPQRMYHLASLASKVEFFDQPRLFYEVILGGTMNLLCAWRDVGMDSRLLYISSAEVYGAQAGDTMPLKEEHPLRPASPYAASKAAAELFALQFFKSYRLPIVRVRPFQHTGPRQSPSFVCSSFARQLVEISLGLRLRKILVGNIKARRDFSDVRDIVRGYHCLLEKGQPGEVYQLCSGRAVSTGQILDILVGLTSQKVEVVVDESKLRDQETPEYWGDPTRAKRAVGWEQQIPLETTLRDVKLYWEQVLTPKLTAASSREDFTQ